MLNKLDATGPSLKPASSPLETHDPPAFLLDCSRVTLCDTRTEIKNISRRWVYGGFKGWLARTTNRG